MLSERYRNDGLALLDLNQLQKEMKEQIDLKVKNKIYQFESVPCCVCNSENFEVLANKDRYGLYAPVVICKSCGLIQTNPRMNQNSYNDFYNIEYRKLYGAGTQEYSTPEGFFEGQYSWKAPIIHNYLKEQEILSNDDDPAQKLIVEVGCASGGILHYFRELGYQVKGVDLGAEFLNYGKKTYGLDLYQGTLLDIEFNKKPDIIIFRQVFEHLLNPQEELAMIRSVLAEDGYIYLEVPGVKRLDYSYNDDFLRLLQNAHTYHFSLATLKNLLTLNGFELVSGNEIIQSVFKKSQLQDNPKTVNDYGEVMEYLKNIELQMSQRIKNSSQPNSWLKFSQKLKYFIKKLVKGKN